MSSPVCVRCGLLSASVLPGGVCETCHARADHTPRTLNGPTASIPPTVGDGPTASLPPGGLDATHAANVRDAFAAALPQRGLTYLDDLGGGGMGKVYKARDEATGRVVAVKQLQPRAYTPSGYARFATEAALLARMDHPNVVRLLQFEPDRNDPMLVMEYVDGQTLADRLEGNTPLPPAEAVQVLVATARGVQAAHAVGVIHRDLKPSNVLIGKGGGVKVADFGLGRDLDETEGLTETGQPVGGTPGYAAPEQVVENPAAAVGPTADVWGLGACLYAALTGHPPFPGGRGNLLRVLVDDLTPPRAKNPNVPPVLEAIAIRCLEKNPSRRYATAGEVADDLERYTRGESTVARPQTWPAKAWQRARRLPRAAVIAWAVAAVVIVAAVGAAAFLPFGKPQTPEEKAKAIQDEYRRELQAGRPVTLIGETGLPRHHAWRMGSPELVVSWTGDGSCAYETVGHTLLELLDDPGVDGYILRVEIRQLNARRQPAGGPASDDEGGVGIYIGFTRIPDGGGGWVTSMHRLSFSDFDPKYMTNPSGAVTDQAVRSAGAMFCSGDGVPPTARFISAGRLFRPSRARPGEWRVVEFEVSSDGITPRWGNTTTDPTLPLQGPMPLDPHKTGVLMQKKATETFPGRVLVLPEWSPRLPLGIYCGSSAVSVRNVTVSPLRSR